AEDGIRVFHVTGVQTCALPIYGACAGLDGDVDDGALGQRAVVRLLVAAHGEAEDEAATLVLAQHGGGLPGGAGPELARALAVGRSEERRGGRAGGWRRRRSHRR